MPNLFSSGERSKSPPPEVETMSSWESTSTATSGISTIGSTISNASELALGKPWESMWSSNISGSSSKATTTTTTSPMFPKKMNNILMQTKKLTKKSDPPGSKNVYQYSVQQKDEINQHSLQVKHKLATTPPADLVQNARERLVPFETRRRKEVSKLLDRMNGQWMVGVEILEAGLEDVDTVIRMVTGFAKAGQLFASNLKAVAEDRFIDDNGDTVTGTFGQKRLVKQRSSGQLSSSIVDDDFGDDSVVTIHDSLSEYQSVNSIHSQVFDAFSKRILQETLPSLIDLKRELNDTSNEIKKLGEKILKSVKVSEDVISKNWSAFEALLVVTENNNNKHKAQDSWLIEQSYITAIISQPSVVELAEKDFKTVLKKVVRFEENHVNTLRSIVLGNGYLRMQRDLFEALPSLDKVSLQLEGIEISTESLDDLLMYRSRKFLKKSQSHRSSIMNRSLINLNKYDDAEVEAIESVFDYKPMDSAMVLFSRLVELEKPGLLGRTSWNMGLIVVTRIGMYHVFELSNSNFASSLEAFLSLLPEMDFSGSSAWQQKKEIISPVPLISFDLKQCSIFIGKRNKREFELVQDCGAFSKFFNTGKDMRCKMRLGSAKDTSEWITSLERAVSVKANHSATQVSTTGSDDKADDSGDSSDDKEVANKSSTAAPPPTAFVHSNSLGKDAKTATV